MRKFAIERDAMTAVHGIIVHQTNSPTATSTLNGYQRPKANGAHFLIDRDGTIYQTASLYKQTWHAGWLKSRCVLEKRCAPSKFNPIREHKREVVKSAPDRFPSNEDSIGIEIVGEALPRGTAVVDEKKVYESVNDAQNNSLKWLVSGLTTTLGVPLHEIFRHPTISRKNLTEASTAKW